MPGKDYQSAMQMDGKPLLNYLFYSNENSKV
jgi:hypothetical protein